MNASEAKFDPEALKRVARKLEEYKEKYGIRLTRALYLCGVEIRNQMIELMRSKLEESIEWEPPRVQSGTLVNSIVYDLVEEGTTLKVLIGPSGPANEYASKLEFGSSENWPHPYARPALRMKGDDCKRRIEEAGYKLSEVI